VNWKADLLPDGNVLLVMETERKEYRWTVTPHLLWSVISLGFTEGYLDETDVLVEIVDRKGSD
jgi:hypothetical protein